MMHSTPSRGVEKIDVAYVANLARLQLTAEEVKTFQAQLTQIVDYVNDLKRVDVSAVEPMAYTALSPAPGRGQSGSSREPQLRKDEARGGLDRSAVLDNAPEHDDEQFLVPKIV